MNTSTGSLKRAKTVKERGVPELIEAVEKGEVPLTVAAKIAKLPEEEQPKALAEKRDKEVPSNEPEEEEEGSKKGVGIRLAHEAINSLTRIPKNDHFRKRGFQIVTDWIRRNK